MAAVAAAASRGWRRWRRGRGRGSDGNGRRGWAAVAAAASASLLARASRVLPRQVRLECLCRPHIRQELPSLLGFFFPIDRSPTHQILNARSGDAVCGDLFDKILLLVLVLVLLIGLRVRHERAPLLALLWLLPLLCCGLPSLAPISAAALAPPRLLGRGRPPRPLLREPRRARRSRLRRRRLEAGKRRIRRRLRQSRRGGRGGGCGSKCGRRGGGEGTPQGRDGREDSRNLLSLVRWQAGAYGSGASTRWLPRRARRGRCDRVFFRRLAAASAATLAATSAAASAADPATESAVVTYETVSLHPGRLISRSSSLLPRIFSPVHRDTRSLLTRMPFSIAASTCSPMIRFSLARRNASRFLQSRRSRRRSPDLPRRAVPRPRRSMPRALLPWRPAWEGASAASAGRSQPAHFAPREAKPPTARHAAAAVSTGNRAQCDGAIKGEERA